MNITFVSDAVYPYSKGGKEKRLYELSTRLATLGNDVHIYTMKWWDGPLNTSTENGVTLHAISKKYDMYEGDKRSIKQGVLFGLSCFKLFRVKFETLDVDHMPYFPIFSAWIVCRLRRKKLYGTWHEVLSRKDWTDYMGVAGNIAYAIEYMAIRLPDYITAASNQTQQALQNTHNRVGLGLVASGIDFGHVQAIEPANDAYDVMYAGRLVKDKNVSLLVAAIKEVTKIKPSVQCLIVGHGVEKNNLQKQIKKLGLVSNIKLLPPVHEARDIYALMKSSKVFCLPSVREGFGIVVLEALACNTPVITSSAKANHSQYLIDHGSNGSVTSLSAENIAREILTWLQLGKDYAFKLDINTYDWSHLAVRQEAIYSA